MQTLTDKPMGIGGRIKSAVNVMRTGKLPNPLASDPPDKSRAALVKELNEWFRQEQAFWKPVHDRMHQEQRFAAGYQWEHQTMGADGKEDFIGDIIQQMVNRKTAVLFAKDPEPEPVMADRLDFTVWNGEQDEIENCKALIASIGPLAQQAAAAEAAGQPVPQPPDQMQAQVAKAEQIMADYTQGMMKKNLLKKVAETGRLLIKKQWERQRPNFETCGKAAVTQIVTSRVAFAKMQYKRSDEVIPSDTSDMFQYSDRLSALQARMKELEQEAISPDDPKRAEAEMAKRAVQDQMDQIQAGLTDPVDEGVVIEWLPSTSVIVDRNCTDLRDFVKAKRIAHKIVRPVADVEADFNISLRDTGAVFYTSDADNYNPEDNSRNQSEETLSQNKAGQRKVLQIHIYDIDDGMEYVLIDGVKDFVREPAPPRPSVNRFWPIIGVTFNKQTIEINNPDQDVTIYPRSDVRLAMPMQQDINTAGQEKRTHRAANRVAWVGVKSKFASTAGQSDLMKLGRPRNSHEILMLESLKEGEKIDEFIQPLPKQPFDNNLYDNSQSSQQMMLATGMQPSDLGTQKPDEKATGQNIAAQARATTDESNVDDLNYLYSTLAQMTWEMCIAEMPQATVKRLVGPGAVFPEISRSDIAQSIYFVIKAGSMGRPNQAAEVQKIQALSAPILDMFKLMNRSPEPFLKLVIKAYDAHIDVDDLLQDSQVMPPPAPAAPVARPPSVSISANLMDLPPEEQEQAVQQFYQLKPAPAKSRLVHVIGHQTAVQAHTANLNRHQPPSGEGEQQT